MTYDPVQAFKDWADMKSREIMSGKTTAGCSYIMDPDTRGQGGPKSTPPIWIQSVVHHKLPLSIIDGDAHEDILERLKGK